MFFHDVNEWFVEEQATECRPPENGRQNAAPTFLSA
jgi:hypothetical protein